MGLRRDGDDDGDLRRAWASIGSGSGSGAGRAAGSGAGSSSGSGRAPGPGLTLDAVDLWSVEAGFIRPVRTARGEHRSRPLVLVQLHGRAGGLEVEGWGECAALADPTYDNEDAISALAVLEGSLVPALAAETTRAGAVLPGPSGLDPVRRVAPGAPLAFAALEMAVADAHLRAEGRTLAQVLGVEERPVPIGAVVGQSATIGALLDEVGMLADQGYARVKMKIGPGWDLEPIGAVTGEDSTLQLQVDANGSYARSDIGHLSRLDQFGLLCLEQPFGRHDLGSHRLLADRITTPVCLDESIDSADAARRALATGACSVVCVKPSRLGGLGAALDLIQSCTEASVPLWMGGMFESGYARGVNATLAVLPGFAWPGDLSPAGSYLEVDPAPGSVPTPSAPGGTLCVLPPSSGGLGRPPEVGILEERRTEWRRILAPGP